MRIVFISPRAQWLLAASIIVVAAGCSVAAVIAADAAAKPVASAPAAGGSDANAIAAIVGGKPIYVRQVEHMLAAATHGQEVSSDTAARMKAAVLLQLVDRQLAEHALDNAHLGATPDEIDAEITHLKTELERARKSLPEYLARTHQTETTLRAELGWQLSWQKFLKTQVTDDSLEAYFKAHHREFDGTDLRVSHILLRPNVVGDDSAVAALVKDAQQIRAQIESGQTTFAAAAEKYSAGPSRRRGGDLGFIPRHGLMVEPFARAAFALEKDQISSPVATVFGIHLIRVTDVKPGDKAWTDVRDALKTALVEHLFEQLVARERSTVPVQYTGRSPYIRPGTAEVVIPR